MIGSPDEDLGDRPLAGVRIADFTFQGAGAYAAMLLGALGAEVIKIESSRRPDPTRGRENRPYLHSLLFDDVNQGKRSMAIDMKKSAGVELALKIIDRSDAVLDNFRPGVMETWGLTYEKLISRNPLLVVASLSAVGHEGHLHMLPGYAGIFNALSGLGDLTGYAGGPPTELRTSVDMRAGAFFAFGVVQGLLDARRNQAGTRIDFSAAESMTALSGEFLTAHAMGLPVDSRHGNDDEQFDPHGVFRTSDGRWVSVAVRDESDWAALARQAQWDDIEAHDRRATLTAWISANTAEAVERTIAASSVPVGRVSNAATMVNDAQHVHRKYFDEVATADGSRTLAAAPWTYGGIRPARSRGPELGEHTHAILNELALDGVDPATLEAEGVLR